MTTGGLLWMGVVWSKKSWLAYSLAPVTPVISGESGPSGPIDRVVQVLQVNEKSAGDNRWLLWLGAVWSKKSWLAYSLQ